MHGAHQPITRLDQPHPQRLRQMPQTDPVTRNFPDGLHQFARQLDTRRATTHDRDVHRPRVLKFGLGAFGEQAPVKALGLGPERRQTDLPV